MIFISKGIKLSTIKKFFILWGLQTEGLYWAILFATYLIRKDEDGECGM